MEKVEVKIGDWLSKGFEMYKNHFGVLIIPSLFIFLAIVVVMLPTGFLIQTGAIYFTQNAFLRFLVPFLGTILGAVLNGLVILPLSIGFILITLKLYDGNESKPEPMDVFKGYSFLKDAFMFALIWSLISNIGLFILSRVPCIGSLLGMALTALVYTLMMFAPYLIADKKMEYWPASMKSLDKVKLDFFPYLAVALVAGILGGVGAIACGIGLIATAPITFCILTVAYRESFGNGVSPATDAAAVQPDVAPPPPPPPPPPPIDETSP